MDQEGNFPYTLLYLNFLTMSMNSYIRFLVFLRRRKVKALGPSS